MTDRKANKIISLIAQGFDEPTACKDQGIKHGEFKNFINNQESNKIKVEYVQALRDRAAYFRETLFRTFREMQSDGTLGEKASKDELDSLMKLSASAIKDAEGQITINVDKLFPDDIFDIIDIPDQEDLKKTKEYQDRVKETLI